MNRDVVYINNIPYEQGPPPKVAKSIDPDMNATKSITKEITIKHSKLWWFAVGVLAFGVALGVFIQGACLLAECYVAPESEFKVVPPGGLR